MMTTEHGGIHRACVSFSSARRTTFKVNDPVMEKRSSSMSYRFVSRGPLEPAASSGKDPKSRVLASDSVAARLPIRSGIGVVVVRWRMDCQREKAKAF